MYVCMYVLMSINFSMLHDAIRVSSRKKFLGEKWAWQFHAP